MRTYLRESHRVDSGIIFRLMVTLPDSSGIVLGSFSRRLQMSKLQNESHTSIYPMFAR